MIYPGICEVLIVPYSVSLKMSQEREREEIPCFPLQLKEITIACPKETCSKGLAALKSVAKLTCFFELALHIWCFSSWQLTSLTFSVTPRILLMTALLLPPNRKCCSWADTFIATTFSLFCMESLVFLASCYFLFSW